MKNTKSLILVIIVALCLVSPAAPKTESDINAKVAQLDIDKATLDDVIRIFGEPTKYIWGKETFTKDNLPSRYIASYPDGFSVFMLNGQIAELRFAKPGAGYIFKNKLQIGSVLDKVLEVIGQPAQTVEGQPNKFEDGVLYKDIDGRKGHCFYESRKHGVAMWFVNDNVHELIIDRAQPTQGKE